MIYRHIENSARNQPIIMYLCTKNELVSNKQILKKTLICKSK